jgi:YfiR/HmsC-like
MKKTNGCRYRRYYRILYLQVIVFALLLTANPVFSEIKVKYEQKRLKTYFLRRIPKHVEWPRSSNFNDESKHFNLTVIGKNPFGKWLNSTFPRKKIRKKTVNVRIIKDVKDIGEPHLLFVGEMPRKELNQVLAYIAKRPILTVSDTEGYAKRGIHVNIYVVDTTSRTNLGLEINETATRQSGLLMKPSILINSRVLEPYNEYREKAIRLEQIANDVHWPPAAQMTNKASSFNIAVLGASPMGRELKRIYKRKRVKNKRVTINQISSVNEVGNSHLLFISQSNQSRLSRVLAFTKNKPILTLGDTDGFARFGVHVNYIFEGVKLICQVNPTAAHEAGLAMGGSLLKDGRIVRSRSKAGQ